MLYNFGICSLQIATLTFHVAVVSTSYFTFSIQFLKYALFRVRIE